MLPDLTAFQWLLLALGATGIGISKSGFAGVSFVHVLAFAFVFEAKRSTGILLPMLVVGDIGAVLFFGKKAEWQHVQKLLPPTMLGVILGTAVMVQMGDAAFAPLVGAIVLGLTFMQLIRMWRPDSFEHIPHSTWFAWTLGIIAGMTTMLANAAGPIVALYLLAISLPKLELVGTSAWLFLVLNIFKLPFSYYQGLIDMPSLTVDLLLAPLIFVGVLVGKWAVTRISQKLFNSLLLAFTAIAALRLFGWI